MDKFPYNGQTFFDLFNIEAMDRSASCGGLRRDKKSPGGVISAPSGESFSYFPPESLGLNC
jgi:hypothetical protein